VTPSAPAVVGTGVDADEKAVAEAKEPRMELSAHGLYQDAALVLCRRRDGTRGSPLCLNERHHGYLASVGRRIASASGGAIGRKAS